MHALKQLSQYYVLADSTHPYELDSMGILSFHVLALGGTEHQSEKLKTVSRGKLKSHPRRFFESEGSCNGCQVKRMNVENIFQRV